MKHRFSFSLFLAVLALVLSAGTALAQANQGIHSIRGFLPDLRFNLQSAKQTPITEKALKGKVVLLFFGYANCPDICPTTMVQLAEVVEKLGNKGDQVRIVFISVDPHRDTPEILESYVRLFDDDAWGLTGTEKQIADIARRYRVAYQIEKPKPDNPKQYEVAHSRGIYIFDQQGRARFLAADGESVDALTAAVDNLIP